MSYLTEIPWWHYPVMFFVYSFITGLIFLCGFVAWILWTNKEIHLIKDEDDAEEKEIHS